MILKSFFKLAAIAYVLVSQSSIEQTAAMNTIVRPFTGRPPYMENRFQSTQLGSVDMKSLLESIRANDAIMQANPQSIQANQMYFLLTLLRC